MRSRRKREPFFRIVSIGCFHPVIPRALLAEVLPPDAGARGSRPPKRRAKRISAKTLKARKPRRA